MRWPWKVISPERILLQAGDGAQDRGLAGAVGADQRDGLALVDVERHALQRIDVVVVELDVREREKLRHRSEPDRLVFAAEIGLDHLRRSAGSRPACPRRSSGRSSSTTIRSEIFITAGMSCSTSSTVTPRSRTPRTRSTASHGLVVVHAGERLVEQQDLGFGGEPDGDAERAQMAVRQVARHLVATSPRPRKSRISSAERPKSASSRAGRAGAEIEAEQAGARAQVMGDDDIVAHASCP